MRSLILATAAGALLASVPAASMAACAAPSVRVNTKAAMSALLTGNTACVPPVTQPTMDAQEEHLAGGLLFDFKRGPVDPVDPRKQIGTWSVSGADGRGVFVTYDYGGGKIFTYSVWDNGDGTHSLCSANPEIKARIKSGGGGC
ncbi:MAG: hypothetical protein AMXMBFR66_08100 [Pseudomonadota bacterium]|nr:hypothetical protein [Rubrivivax sp.]